MKKSEITVIKTGTKATTAIGNIEGFITAIAIREQRVTYEFCYFSGQEYKTIWLSD